MVRRILLGAFALLIAMAAPAAADDRYSHVLGDNGGRSSAPSAAGSSTGGSSTGGSGDGDSSIAATASSDGSRLARTGSSAILPLAQVATVLIGSGAVLVLATRRRRGSGSSAAV